MYPAQSSVGRIGASDSHLRGSLLIVDFVDSDHGRAMRRVAEAVSPTLVIDFLAPGAQLPGKLQAAIGRYSAVAIPGHNKGANPRDRFTQAVAEAIGCLRSAGTEVFISAGARHPNPWAGSGIAVAPEHSRMEADLYMGPAEGGASGACVLAASAYATSKLLPSTNSTLTS